MALIYSRPRIHLPKIWTYYLPKHKRGKKQNKVGSIIGIVLIGILIGMFVLRAIKPIFNQLCSDKAKSVATVICNQITTQALQGYQYSDFIHIHRDKNENIVMLESNMVKVNLLTSKIAEEIQKAMNQEEEEEIYIASGNLTGIHLLSGRGPKIKIKISTIGNIETQMKSEFIAQGINQTLHRIYLEIQCEVIALTPFNTINEKIYNQLLIAENIIVGTIPSTYYNLEGVQGNNIMDTIQ